MAKKKRTGPPLPPVRPPLAPPPDVSHLGPIIAVKVCGNEGHQFEAMSFTTIHSSLITGIFCRRCGCRLNPGF